jgi:hypothetical protein
MAKNALPVLLCLAPLENLAGESLDENPEGVGGHTGDVEEYGFDLFKGVRIVPFKRFLNQLFKPFKGKFGLIFHRKTDRYNRELIVAETGDKIILQINIYK